MKEYLAVLERSKLFNGLAGREILSILNCLNAMVKPFEKNAVIFHDGGEAGFIGLILSGEVQTQKTDYNGNLNIVSRLFPADLIAASACFSGDKRLPFDVVCVSACELLCMDINRLTESCCNACSFHARLIQNILNIIADRNIMLAGKIDILTKRTIKEKVLTYLYAQSKRARNQRFSVPMSRRQMAEFFSVDRSALSRELSGLRDEGLLEFEGNSFLLKTFK